MENCPRESELESVLGDERLRRVLDAAPDALLVIDPAQIIRFANAPAERLFGFPRSALVGRELDIVIPTRLRAAHALHVRDYFSAPSAREMGSSLDLVGTRSDGSEIPVEVSLSPLELGNERVVTAAVRDVTERKRGEAAARAMTTRLSSAVESIQDAFALFDEESRLVLCNEAYRRLFASLLPGEPAGRSPNELLQSWTPELELGADAARVDFVAPERLSDAPRSDRDVRTRDGRTLRISNRPTPEGGLVSTIWDLTEDARIAEELRVARREAESASAAKSQFLSSMSHELRTPLNAILGFAQLLALDRRQPLEPKHRERVARILESGEHLLRLIDDILDLSRIEAGGVSISTEPVNVLEVLEQVRTTLEPVAVDKVRIELTAEASEVPLILADRTRFMQILMNFGSNGVKYNRPAGRVTFAVSMPHADRIRVTVSDTGVGIPQDKQASVFQPFQRAGQENGPIHGTGIGLTITKRLAELMGGGVGFSSVSGEGSEFWVEMPVHGSRKRSVTPPGVRVVRSEPPLLTRKLRVLYVEGDPANVALMGRTLQVRENIKFMVARTGEEGLVMAHLRKPDVLILDVHLPGMSGLDALRALRRHPNTASIPVIALAMAPTEHDRQSGTAAGFFRYLSKPLDSGELDEALRSLPH